MSTGLPVSRLINVDVNLSPNAAQAPNLNSLLIIGSSDVIDTQTRIVSYSSLAAIGTDFGSSAPEYLAAANWFAQRPSPTQVYIGRWAQTPTAGRLIGGALTADQKLLSNFTAITNGGFKIGVDGAAVVNVTGINLTGVTNLNGVASAISSALTSATVAATASWDGSRFTFKSNATGAPSAIAFLQAPTAGINLAPLLNGTEALGARVVGGIGAETALDAVIILDSKPVSAYAYMFAAPAIVDADHLAVAAYIEAAGSRHVYGLTTASPGAIDPINTSDIMSLLQDAGYTRTISQYSSRSPYAIASLFGRILTTDFNANNSMITLMYKQEPGVTAEQLTTQQADALQAKNGNVFVAYDNDTAIIQYGTVASGLFFDEVYGTDWLKFRIETDLFNALYTSTNKIPQTDQGMGILATVIEGSLSLAVNNGLVAPGTWNSGGFGILRTGDYMPSGFYVYSPPVGLQSSADRAARKSVAFVVGAKLAGAVHTVDVLVNIDR